MNELFKLPQESDIQTPLDPQKQDLVLPDTAENDDFKLPDSDSILLKSYFESSDYNPDHVAKVNKYSRELNENPNLVERNIKDAEKVINSPSSEYWNEYEKRFPESAKFLKNNLNMAMAHDDHENIAKTEDLVNKSSFLSDAFDSFNQGLDQTYSGMLRIPGAIYNYAAIPQNLIVKSLGHPEMQVSSDNFKEINPLEKAAQYYDKQSDSFKVAGMENGIMGEIEKGNYSKAARNLALSFIQNMPNQIQNVAMAASGYSTAGLALAGLQQGASAFEESNKSGADPLSRTLDSAYQGTMEALFENLGTFGAFKKWENAIAHNFGKDTSKKVMSEFAKTMAYTGLSEGNEEFWTQIGQDFSKYATGVDNNAMDGTLERSIDAGLVGAFSGGTMTGPSAIAMGIQRSQQIQKSNVLSKQYEELGNVLNESKLKQRDSETHEALVDSMVQNGPMQDIYIPADKFTEYFQSKNKSPEDIAKELGIEKDLSESIETGGNVKIPFAKWQSKISKEDYHGLKDDVKFSENSFSVNENKKYSEQLTEQIKQIDSNIMESGKEHSDNVNQYEAIYNDIYKQLVNTGMKEDVAKQNAKIASYGFVAQAHNAGEDSLNFYRSHNLNILNKDGHAPIMFERNSIPEYHNENIVGNDQVIKALDELGLPESYKHPEALSAIREQIASLNDEVNVAEAGSRNFTEGKIGNEQIVTGTKSTFPKWFAQAGFKDKATFQKVASKGNSKHLKNIVQLAINGLKEGHGTSEFNLMPPNLDFVSLVDPSSLEKSKSIHDQINKVMAQKHGEYFQKENDIRKYIDQKTKGKPILVINDRNAPAAEYDSLTGHLNINSEKVKTSGQVDEILKQFGESKREAISGNISANINGEEVSLDAGKLVNALARKLYNLQRLAECSRG